MLRSAILFAMLLCACAAAGQQLADRDFEPIVTAPAYEAGKGPVVCVDEAHHNLHTLGDRYFAFGELLRRDGYVLRTNTALLDAESLAACDILVISNARPSPENRSKKSTSVPSAFTQTEIAATRRWVEQGGSLLLIADHMPFPGAVIALAAAFEIEFTDGFAVAGYDSDAERREAMAKPTIFRRQNGADDEKTNDITGANSPNAYGTLADHPVVRGRKASEAIDRLRSFTGQAFRASDSAQPVLVLPEGFISLYPSEPWVFEPDTKKIAVGGWLQGATLEIGAGRAAFFGEAGMFTAQLSGPKKRPMGMNAPGAEQNPQFILNLLHWLSGEL